MPENDKLSQLDAMMAVYNAIQGEVSRGATTTRLITAFMTTERCPMLVRAVLPVGIAWDAKQSGCGQWRSRYERRCLAADPVNPAPG
jgi:hypothetical protein